MSGAVVPDVTGINYEPYLDAVRSAVTSESAFVRFKDDARYKTFLEHVSYELGLLYLARLLRDAKLSKDNVRDFCCLNDAAGGGTKERYEALGIRTSPTNFRYLLFAHLILTHMKDVGMSQGATIVEIGAGYGGLSLALNNLAPLYGVSVLRYCYVDLEEVLPLQQKYVGYFRTAFARSFYPASEHGQSIEFSDMFLVSTFCFSQLSAECKVKYMKHLFPKVKHGFMAWNRTPVFDFGFRVTRNDEEEPRTGPSNRYVYF